MLPNSRNVNTACIWRMGANPYSTTGTPPEEVAYNVRRCFAGAAPQRELQEGDDGMEKPSVDG